MLHQAILAAGLLLGGLTVSCTLPPAPVLRQDVQPLGRHWVYRVSDPSGNELGRIESKIVAVDGNTITQETTETFDGKTTTRASTATFQPDGSLLVEEADGKLTPLPSIRRLLSPGAKWQNPDGTAVTVIQQESVTVPAGTYNAYKLQLTKDGTITFNWLTPTIGLIKETTDQTIVELVSVSNG